MKLTEPVPGGPCWVELSTSDVPGAAAFYAALFGWRAETDPRPEAGGYTMARLGEDAVAALSPVYRPDQRSAWTVSFATEDADAASDTVRSAGGTLLMGPMDVFDQGRFAVAADPAGAVFSLWQPRAFAGAGLLDAPGALGWAELLTPDPEGALAFYPAVFDWTVDATERYTHWGVDGAEFGGMKALDGEEEPQTPPRWVPYFTVVDVEIAAATALGAGGRPLVPPRHIPGGPSVAVLSDPQGAAFGVHAP
ncbi:MULTISPECIES: VOC family protein [Streptomyces]|uniref:Enzyme related to lactoylglutathione lyase n=1 Tax=Streptomyces clavifer TaxID=68188 RepID=A0ABS4V1N4_9ACTN|nr:MULTISPECIES: VOC family protein [Streptomyces]MBP2357823.1 putative enzyme related to lactoylglutathione lyase [Streptomyces clavifer]MDX2742504.1 VOC family protein [Streptomyces sp. NRRL_B-2557]GHA86523.1 hydroxylase [Streptomyces clavifer]